MADRPVLILGAGIAGLWTALKLAPRPVTLVTGAPLGFGAATGWAQGGIAAALAQDDSPALHVKDTLSAGDGLTCVRAAGLLASGIAEEVAALRALGVPFDTDAQGRLTQGLEAAHSRPRIAHVSGDRAGAAILDVLVRAVRAADHITIRESWRAVALLPSRDGGCAGALLQGPDGQTETVEANDTVLAMGGAGGLWQVSTSPAGALGQAIAMAARIGAEIADPEFVQFHPTAMDLGRDPAPLATEALRGAGAVLIDRDGKALMDGVHDALDLAPRDIVARTVHRARQTGRKAFLDAREAIGQAFPDRFPTVFAACMDAGLDPRTTPIPVAPAAHYHMGGVFTGMDGETSLPGLWAVGECAANGLHGANRLASNSLAEGLVFGARAAHAIRMRPGPDRIALRAEAAPVLPLLALTRLRQAMGAECGVERTGAGLERLLGILDGLAARYGEADPLLAARFVVAGALRRQESRGSHWRLDYPAKAESARHTRLALEDIATPANTTEARPA
ncbi:MULTISPECIES: L-aspartate oxidase [Hyphobacterium]|uniref:L-aspartate oxidase n=1 Tax=Hyphobacterium vulgare TaxID=1736751 RepID=A0ABV6ZZ18_9PROT